MRSERHEQGSDNDGRCRLANGSTVGPPLIEQNFFDPLIEPSLQTCRAPEQWDTPPLPPAQG